ncbi:trehalose-phosphatase [Corynebacterium sp. 3HC-13]|uniref:trehalose-phosphatase n=1 Tax=Corynebacterium poyangense TaxID=2684405 RepID=UPI001CCEF509|nr:trehalose-phosphatase [Corynebacterium poyangense]MBZ8176422.1 trehalose-phosphatase [Corynebacterium poyangense]
MSTLSDLATTDELLVVSDFDGTLAGFHPSDIYDVPINGDSIDTLARLSQLPHTTVAVLSGRHLAGLQKVCPLESPVIFAGSHGAETSGEPSGERGPDAQQLSILQDLDEQLEAIVAAAPRAYVEKKPYHRVVHVAELAEESPETAAEICDAAAQIRAPGLTSMRGKNIVEFSVSGENKGTWISRRRTLIGATGVLFIGDDTTDELGFATLSEADLGVKVGPGDTAATLRVDDLAEVARIYQELAELRTLWARRRDSSSRD